MVSTRCTFSAMVYPSNEASLSALSSGALLISIFAYDLSRVRFIIIVCFVEVQTLHAMQSYETSRKNLTNAK
jgi:hypothetical protein